MTTAKFNECHGRIIILFVDMYYSNKYFLKTAMDQKRNTFALNAEYYR